MFRHVVMFRFTAESTEDQQEAGIAELRGLEQSIPTIRSLTVGRNAGPGPTNYDLILEVDFDSADGFKSYGPHESHQRVWKSILQPICTELAVIQYDLP